MLHVHTGIFFIYVPVEMPEAGELVDFDGVPKAGKVNGVHLLLDERQVVPDEAALDDLRLVRCPHQPLGKGRRTRRWSCIIARVTT